MNCHYHPDRGIARECRICHELVCTECVVPVGEHAVCKSCVAQTMTLDDTGAQPQVRADKKKQKAVSTIRTKVASLNAGHKSGFLTILFSCLPGLGHFYLGLQARGVNLMIIFFAIIFVNTVVPNSLQFASGIAIPILWFYSQVDALKYRSLINQGETVADTPIIPNWRKMMSGEWVGWALAAVGGMALVYSVIDLASIAGFDNWGLREALKEIITAALLIGAGWWILKGKKLPFPAKQEESEDQQHA